MAALVSVLVSIASRSVGPPDTPSLVRIETSNITAASVAQEPVAAVVGAATVKPNTS